MYKYFLSAVILIGVLSGCGGDETRHALYRKAVYYRAQNLPYKAERCWQKFLQRYPESAAGHLALAALYDEELKSPLKAVYFYSEYLRLAPDSPQYQAVESWIRRGCEAYLAQQRQANGAGGQPGTLQADNALLRKQVEQQQRYIDALKKQILRLQK